MDDFSPNAPGSKNPEKSYTAKPGSMGTTKITQKLGEETIETIVVH